MEYVGGGEWKVGMGGLGICVWGCVMWVVSDWWVGRGGVWREVCFFFMVGSDVWILGLIVFGVWCLVDFSLRFLVFVIFW